METEARKKWNNQPRLFVLVVWPGWEPSGSDSLLCFLDFPEQSDPWIEMLGLKSNLCYFGWVTRASSLTSLCCNLFHETTILTVPTLQCCWESKTCDCEKLTLQCRLELALNYRSSPCKGGQLARNQEDHSLSTSPGKATGQGGCAPIS